ncbi:MAG: InlB B-repeat-containing protein [Bacilli bacterium]|nr:InlB B-repeat-containing protein [Bacilli bacterium]
MKKIVTIFYLLVFTISLFSSGIVQTKAENTVITETSSIIGDLDNSGKVDTSDVIYLLYHVMFGDSYSVSQDSDYDYNGVVDSNDVVYLLYHVMFGEASYPLIDLNATYYQIKVLNEELNECLFFKRKAGTSLDMNISLSKYIPAGYKWDGKVKYSSSLENFTEANVSDIVVNGDLYLIPIYEKAPYKITYELDGGIVADDLIYEFFIGDEIVLPTPTKEGYKFLGWYENDVLIEEISNRNYDLVAKWEIIEEGTPKVNYVLEEDVYLTKYASRSELITELIADIQSVKGVGYTLSYFESHTSSGYGIFANTQGNKTFFSDDAMRTKWTWLLEYMKSLRSEAGLDVAQYDDFIKNGYLSADAATINVEMIALICGKQYSYSSYSSSDYSKESNKNGYIKALHNVILNNNTFEKGTLALDFLPNASKDEYLFAGWYTTKDFKDYSKITENTVLSASVTVYPKFVAPNSDTIIFDYEGGVTEELYLKYGNKLTSLIVSSYNGAFWTGTNYASDIFVSTPANDPTAKFSTRIYIKKNMFTDLYEIVSILTSGTTSVWPDVAEYVITISGSYNGAYDDNFNVSNINVGDIVVFDKPIENISSTPANVYFCSENLNKEELEEKVDLNFVIPEPKRVGHKFLGWYDANGKKYEENIDFTGVGNITVYAKWKYEDYLIGSFKDNSWVVVGDEIQLIAEYVSGSKGTLKWESKTPDIASVDEYGFVNGIKEGLATIVVSDTNYPDIIFTFYVTVLQEDPTGILKLLVDSNNESIYKREDLIIGIITEAGYFYADIVGSVSKLLFEDYVVHDDYYLSNPSNKSTLNGDGINGIDFITFHYAADMHGSAANGGKNLATFNKSCNTGSRQASWHYGTGNDGIWACQTESYGAWHAGASKRMTWTKTNIKYNATDPEFPKVTLGSDNYFYINGLKTNVKNTTSGTRLNDMGLACEARNGYYYLGGHYYNSTYKYISSTGGNNNSIGIESSCAKGSDLWLTWQYSAQLCAKLLIKYNLPLNRLVGHHFFSGKWCPQPMLEYDLEIWWEFVELVRQEMELYKNYNNYTLTFSSDSAYLKDNGRISSLPTYSECVTYTITYKTGNTTKTVTLSSIIPGLVA